MIVVIAIALLIFGIMFYFLGPKKIRVTNFLSILINRSTIALLLALIILVFSFFYMFYWGYLPHESDFKTLLDSILGFPTLIVLIAGISVGGGLAFIALAAEVIVLTVIIRFLIPRRWPATLIAWLKFKRK